ncbi:MAG: PspC domain-containing protein [Sphingobacteriia bacterium]|nr:PspC domain-containing protein [Sphingobacteriia bacterium]
MKKNFQVNIGGRLFNIDEDAYRRLDEYFGRLRDYLGGNGEAAEILRDIEARMADLLMEKSDNGQNVVTLAMIEELITGMGQPEEWDVTGNDIDDDDEFSHKESKRYRRLYRDPAKRFAGGVCAGLATWSGVDVRIIRLFFVGFTFFYLTGLVLYAVLWLVLPVAASRAARLEMAGEEVTVDNLRKRFLEEREHLQQIGEEWRQSDVVKSSGRLFSEGLLRLFKFIGLLIGKLLGVCLIMMGLGLAIGLTVAMFQHENVEFGTYQFYDSNVFSAAPLMIPGFALRWQFYVSIILLAVSVIGLLVYGGLKLLIGWKISTWQIPALLTVLLAAGGVIFAVSMIRLQDKDKARFSTVYRINLGDTSNGLTIDMIERGSLERFNEPGLSVQGESSLNGNQRFFTGTIEINARPADSAALVLMPSALGDDEEAAKTYVSNMGFYRKYNTGLLELDSRFIVPFTSGVHSQELQLTLELPIGTRVYLDDDMINRMGWRSFADGSNIRDEGWYKFNRDGFISEAELVQKQMESDSLNVKQ